MPSSLLSNQSSNLRIRKNFSKIKSVIDVPNLLDLQRNSYEEHFLQLGLKHSERKNKGMHLVFHSAFPIIDSSQTLTLEYVSYDLEEPKFEVLECKRRGISYACPLKVLFRIVVWDVDPDTGAREVKSIKEQQVYMGDLPLMTKNGTFVVNGTERVVVSQICRSPGVFFDHDKGKGHASGKLLHFARIIPYRGSWLDIEFDAKDLIYFRIDKRRKIYISTLFRALGLTTKEILDLYYSNVSFIKEGLGWVRDFLPELVTVQKLKEDLIDAQTGSVVLQAGQKITPRLAKKLAKEGLAKIVVSDAELLGQAAADDIVNSQTGELIVAMGHEITSEALDAINAGKVTELKLLQINAQYGPYIKNTLLADKNLDESSALLEIFRVLRPGELSTVEGTKELLHSIFFSPERYDLSEVGRVKMNERLGITTPEDQTLLEKEDILLTIKTLVAIKDGRDSIDDIDNLGNRRVRCVGELIENQFRIGLARVTRSALERIAMIDADSVMPYDLINSKLIMSIIKDFFGTFQLSQFMDQTNPLSEISHKRRISALGPGGLTRDHAGFEVRDVHPTHYGRICPIETPEGQNIGLISSLATFAQINKYGFIEAPFRRVVGGKVTDEVIYLSATQESKYKIAGSTINMNNGKIVDEMVICRFESEFVMAPSSEVNFIDLVPTQVFSVATCLIPLIENDDANRALMGANMQRQAVPLLKSEAPFVGTGIENIVARDSESVILAANDGIVEYVDALKIVIRRAESDGIGVDIYNLSKFQKSNHNTCINQTPIVRVSDVVQKGDVISNGPNIDKGEIALGKNVLIAFVPWGGYNFEDAILISEKVVQKDIYTSVHIEEFELVIRDTRLGPEEVTRDVPNVSDETVRNLDETGIICIGAQIKPGDILVGKVTPKSETPVTSEEKLLRAIFGEKAADVKDSSLYVPPGTSGVVTEVRIFSRGGIEKDQRAMMIEREQIDALAKTKNQELFVIERFLSNKVNDLLLDQEIKSGSKSGGKISQEFSDGLNLVQKLKLELVDSAISSELTNLAYHYEEYKNNLEKRFNESVAEIQNGDDLPQGVLKVVKIFVATKHKLQPGDKMSGRHGNKGVVSKIVPEEDMPFLEDGTVVDVILNPLGIPSRMNIGQVLETHLGWAAMNLGRQLARLIEEQKASRLEIDVMKDFLADVYKNDKESLKKINGLPDEEFLSFCQGMSKGMYFSTPVFDGAKAGDIEEMLNLAGLDSTGQVKLIDGKTGEYFDRKVTVGVQYIMKLHHLVDDKIHARSIGPYSLVTQQPLGGKSYFGGQRFGEMEVWALQAYGASYILQEMITVKSDDVAGRTKTYESIVLNKDQFQYGIPESFKVMVKELRALSLNLQFENKQENQAVKEDTLISYSGNIDQFDQIKINIASPHDVISWSSGEVEKPETINYRTFKPEKGGLCCAKIFGPVKDYECLCGKYKKMKYKDVVCEKCGVEVTVSRVRRERMGHVTLAAPVVHIWFLKLLPSRIGLLLDMQVKNLEKILYFESYVVLDSTIDGLNKGDLVSENEVNEYKMKYGEHRFEVGIGAEGIQSMLKSLDLQALRSELQLEKANSTAATKNIRIAKRLKLIEEFIASGNKPEWMVMTVLPVLPPDLRPLVMLEGGRFATSDLNELYRRVINRNNRLKRLLELSAPEIIIRNEKRMLQEAVDALLDNGRRGKVVKNNNKRPFKSLSDMLKGKQGRFRQNLLGKRVDYSGRSVIVVGPELKLHQCGLPKQMALELFKPFVYAKLQMYGAGNTIKAVKRIVELQKSEVWDALEEVIKDHPVLLNRAPTLHRLSIQAFEPILIEGKAIQLHPLVCSAFNADFDGDQMAVHVPLSIQAQIEARVLMMATNNILSPASGKPILVPDKDIVLGIYYLTLEFAKEPGEGLIFADIDELRHALDNKEVTLHSKIKFRLHNNDQDNPQTSIVDTTPGRILLWDIVPKGEGIEFSLVNKLLNKKDISTLVYTVYRYAKQVEAVAFVDGVMTMGFKYATKSGMSFGFADMAVPESKKVHIEETTKEVKEYEMQYYSGLITSGEKYNKVIDAWSRCTDLVASDLMKKIAKGDNSKGDARSVERLNAVYAISSSGARGSPAQIRQLAGMRGLMAKPNGEIIPYPITSNFLEGLKVTEYFISTNGARKGLTDTALKTANSGYLTRRLVDVAQDCIVSENDCGTKDGIVIGAVIDGGEVVIPLVDQVLARTSALDIKDPIKDEVIIKAGEIFNEEIIKQLEVAGINQVKVRSSITCASVEGMCSKCYGGDLSRKNRPVAIGEAVGIIAAQSIGEPGTQLTMRTFHIGGAATKGVEVSSIEFAIPGTIKFINKNVVQNSAGRKIVMSRACEVILLDSKGIEKSRYKVPYGARLLVNDGQSIDAGEKVADWDPYTIPIIVEKAGKIVFQDIISGISMKDTADESTGITSKVIIEARKSTSGAELKPRIHLTDENGETVLLANGLEARYYMPVNAILTIEDGSQVNTGDIIARIPKESTKTKDITGGLPRVTELFEARKPKDRAIIADIDGKLEFGKDYKSKRRVILHALDGSDQVEYIIAKGKHISFNDGDVVKKGEMIVDGHYVLQDILRVMGTEALSHYMCQEIQNVYRLQGVKIDNKHIEIIVRQMLQKVEIKDAGDSSLLVGEKCDKQEAIALNKKLIEQDQKSIQYELVLQGITKASLQTTSFISAASFQETTRVLAEAAVAGKVDRLKGLKENVIVGRLIPAGTGFYVNSLLKEAQERDKLFANKPEDEPQVIEAVVGE